MAPSFTTFEENICKVVRSATIEAELVSAKLDIASRHLTVEVCRADGRGLSVSAMTEIERMLNYIVPISVNWHCATPAYPPVRGVIHKGSVYNPEFFDPRNHPAPPAKPPAGVMIDGILVCRHCKIALSECTYHK